MEVVGGAARGAVSCGEEEEAAVAAWRGELVAGEVGGARISSSVAVGCGCAGSREGFVEVDMRGSESWAEEGGSAGSGGGLEGGGGMRSVTVAADGRPAVMG